MFSFVNNTVFMSKNTLKNMSTKLDTNFFPMHLFSHNLTERGQRGTQILPIDNKGNTNSAK